MADWVGQLVARLPAFNGMPDETVENVFHVGAADPWNDGAWNTPLMEAVRDFYTVVAAGATLTVGQYIGESVSRVTNAAQVLLYRNSTLDGTVPFGSPIASLSFTVPTAAAGDPYPEEVASVISYHADLTDVPVSIPNPTPPPATIRPAQRQRGRCYVGPLQVSAGVGGGNQSRPSATFRTNATEAFKELAETINAIDPTLYFGIWSKADAEVWQATAGWMDDAWDTQRRRGVEATTRTAFTIA